jgi:general secretion pathway protein E
MTYRIGQILVKMGRATEEQVTQALATQQAKGGRLGDVMVKMGICEPTDVQKAVSEQLDLPFESTIVPDDVDIDLIKRIPLTFFKRASVLPIKELDDGTVLTACADPLAFQVLDDLELLLGTECTLFVAPEEQIISAINTTYDKLAESTDEVMEGVDSVKTDDIEDLDIDIMDIEDDEAPIIRLVNHLLTRAVKERTSDVHIEPFEDEIVIRYRIDGVLYEILKPPKRIHNSVVSRVKIMANLNIAEKRIPQDGRIRIKIAGKDIDIRTSIIPTAHGERVVMRLLDRSAVRLDLTDLGLDAEKNAVVEDLIHHAHGIILVTGPTGSGKTTTLYAALTELNSPDRNILTVEDPIEYQIKGIGQMQVNRKIELTFASGLRHFLRQDPDVILVGEIRDVETAEIAVQASLTGHLVFSTLHTNDSASAITRLVDMGVEPFLVSSSLLSVIAQRLVRVLCNNCRQPHDVTPEELAKINLRPEDLDGHTIYKPVGCSECVNTGYQGRTAIYEILAIDDKVRNMILNNIDSNTIKRHAIDELGMLTLRDDGARRVLTGRTSIEEVLRVTQEDFA